MKTILIVDDQPEVTKLLAMVLRGEDRRIITAASGETALALARQHAPDLVLMDVMMPGGMDGYEATRHLKEDPATGRCPVIIVTAKTQARDREEALASGAEDFIAKPFDLQALKQKVAGYLM